MTAVLSRDVEYSTSNARMIGALVSPEGASALPAILLIHDAFGLGDDAMALAHRYAELGYTVFAADVWGDRTTAADDSEIGPLIGSMVGNRAEWIARVTAAHFVLAALPEGDPAAIVAIGYCFGGSSTLELLRTGASLRGVVSVHGGLDLLDPDWSHASGHGSVLLCSGADDPMATSQQLAELRDSLDGAGVDWELDIYSGTVHGFTNPKGAFSPAPHVFAYNARSAARAWERTTRFLTDLLHPEL